MTAPAVTTAADAQQLHRDIDAGFLLPTRWYADPAIFQAELERIHRRAWHFLTHTGDLRRPGDVYVRNVAGVPIVLVRGADGEVRGFLNICRHRGHPVVLRSGNQQKLRCHQHAWTYRLDGRLQHAPRSAGDPGFDPARFGLVPIQTHVWGPMVWANLDPSAPPFEDWIEGMPALMRARGLDVAEHAFGFDHSWDIHEMALAWILREPSIASVAVGVSRVEQLEDNLKALDRLEFGAEELEAIDRLTLRQPVARPN